MSRRFLCLLAVALIVLTGCQASSKVDVNVESNGSGTVAVEVQLDQQAAAAVPNLAEQLRTGDLAANGWKVDDPSKASSGDTLIKLHHGFDNIDQANALMAQLSGTSGVLTNFKLTQKRSLTKVQTEFAGSVDLRNGIESFGDDVVKGRTGSPLGFDPNEVSKSLGVNWQASFPVDVAVHLPGGSRTSSPEVGKDRVWHATYGSVTPLQAHASGLNTWPLAFFALALLFAIAAIAIAVLWTSRTHKPQHRRKSGGIRARDLLAQPGAPAFIDLGDEERVDITERETVR